MNRRHRANAAKMSLFPFLDVLVCTMGSLILLLLVATSRIRAAAVEKAKQAAIVETTKRAAPAVTEPAPIILNPEPEPDDDPTPEWQTRVEQLTAQRDDLRNQLAPLRSRLAAAQSAVMRTKVKAVSAEDRLQEVRQQQQDAGSERERLQSDIDALQSDLTDAERQLAKAVERQNTAKSKFAFMPFDGRTGTTKRPILIECTQDCIRFLPENVRLTPAELNGFTIGFNPLLIASRELIHYWKAYERVHASNADPNKDSDSFESDLAVLNNSEHEPYVLLLVRPNGATAFHIAKSLLAQLKVPHGYELITDDMEIDTSNPDLEAKHICQAAVTHVLAERDKLLLAIARSREQQRDQLQLDSTSRNFVTKDNDDSPTGFERSRLNRSSRSSATTGSKLDGSSLNGPANSGSAFDRSSTSGNSVSPSSDNDSATHAAGTNSPSVRGRASDGSARETYLADRIGAPDSAGSDVAPRNHGATLQFGHRGDTETPIAPSDRSRTNEPPEERLPMSSGNRFADDDSKPFPFTGERTKSAATRGTVAGAPTSKSNPARPGARPTNDPRGANNSTSANGTSSGNNFARMKRRYLTPRSGIGIEKTIPIRISARRVLVGGEFEIPIEAGVKTESLIDRVLMAMDRVQSGWPNAGAGYHWVPTIKYEVVPGGEQAHQRLNSGLFDLGLVSTVQFLDADPDVAKPSRETSRSRAATSSGGGAR